MRLLLAAPCLERPGGVSRSVLRIAWSLEEAGHEVVVCSPDEDLFPGDVRDSAGAFRFGPRARGLDAACAEHTEAIVHAAASSSHPRPDAIIGFYATTAGRAATRAALRLGVPSLVCLRGNDVDVDIEDPARGPAAREAIGGATALTAVSREMCHKVSTALGVSPVFVTNAVDPSRFRPDPAGAARLRSRLGLGDRPVLGLFGEIKAKRGLARLRSIRGVEAFDLLVVGHLRPESRADLPANALCIEPIEDDEELCGAYSACDAVVQPSLQDGMPNVVLEAMACARTVIVARVGGLVDLVVHGETGWICGSDDAWQRALSDLRAGLGGELGPRARARAPRPEAERDAMIAAIQGAIRRYAASSATR